MNKQHILFSAILITGCFFKINAQSDLKKLNKTEDFIKKSNEYVHKNIDSALYFADQAQILAKELDNDTLLAKSNLQKSSALMFKKKLNEADSLLNQNLLRPLPPHLEAQTLRNQGNIQYYKQDFEKALNIYLKAAKILERTKDTESLVAIYANIGSINSVLKNFKNASTYLERALPLSEHNEALRLQVLLNLSNIYKEQRLYKKFASTIFEAEKLAEKNNSKRILSVIYNNLSNYYNEDTPGNNALNYDLSISYGKKSVVLKKELSLFNSLPLPYNNIGHSYLKKGQYAYAIKYLDSAVPGAQGVLKTYVYNNLKEAHEGLKDYKGALLYSDLMNQYKDSINEANQREKVAKLTEQFESEKKQQQIDVLDTKNQLQALTITQQNYLLAALIVFALLIIILGYFGFKTFKTKQQLDTVVLQQKLRKMQLNPHFLFNALQSIQNFIHQNDTTKSSSYLANYSKLIRMILDKSNDDFITVEDDKLALEAYLKLQQLTYNNTFSYQIGIDNSVDEDFDTLPPLITQPFVENAVLHGLKNVSDGCVIIKYYKENNVLYVSISDNGKGFRSKTEESKKLHKSMSMGIIKEQLKNLSKSIKGFEGNISIDTSNSGTQVTLSFITT